MSGERKGVIAAADDAVAELRAQIRSLLGLIDTARPPEPDGRIGGSEPGVIWKPARGWFVRTFSEDASRDHVYVHASADIGSNVEAMRVDEARAMSILAACEWAEQRRSHAPHSLPETRPRAEDAGGCTFICGL